MSGRAGLMYALFLATGMRCRHLCPRVDRHSGRALQIALSGLLVGAERLVFLPKKRVGSIVRTGRAPLC